MRDQYFYHLQNQYLLSTHIFKLINNKEINQYKLIKLTILMNSLYIIVKQFVSTKIISDHSYTLNAYKIT